MGTTEDQLKKKAVLGFTVAPRRGKAIPIRLDMAYDKEKEIKLAGLLTKTCFFFFFKESEVSATTTKRNLYGVWNDQKNKNVVP